MVNLVDLHDLRVEQQDLSSGALTIEASDRESHMIMARGIASGGDDDIVTESIDEETMLAYPAPKRPRASRPRRPRRST